MRLHLRCTHHYTGIVGIIALVSSLVFADPPANSRWNMTFSDEFNGTSLNTAKWMSGNNWGQINGEPQGYQASQISVADGKCVLTCEVKTNTFGGKTMNYASGEISSKGKFSQNYGYFEASLKLPRGAGMWPAFWLMDLPEIDIFELVNKTNSAEYDYGTNVFLNYSGTGQIFSGAHCTGDVTAGYHTYGAEWQADSVRFYCDGVPQGKVTTGVNSSNAKYIICNLAIKTPNEAYMPAKMYIDWVRAWTKLPIPADNTPPTAAPSGFTAQVLSDTKIRLSWQQLADATDPETGIKSYALYKDGVKSLETREIFDTVSGLTEATPYTFAVAGINWRDLEGPRATATATTLADTAKPKMAFAFARDSMHIVVHFSETVQKNAAETVANYSLTGGIAVTSAVLDNTGREVVLITSRMSAGTSGTLTASTIIDLAKVPNTTNTSTFPIKYPAIKGVLVRYYERNYACVLPAPEELEALVPQKQTILTGFSVATTAISRIHNFEMLYSSYLLVPTAGSHVYTLAACDGAALYLDGQKIIDNGGCHPRAEMRSAPIILEAGAYPIKIVYGDSAGSPTLMLMDSIVGGKRQLIADSSLLILENISAVSTRPAIAQNGAASGLRVLQSSSGEQKSRLELSVIGMGENAEEMSAKIYDMRGSLVGMRHFGPLSAVSNCLGLGNLQLKPGRYVCAVTIGALEMKTPFVVVR